MTPRRNENYKKTKVALVGGNGFIGRHVTKKLAGSYRVDIWDLPDADVRDPASLAGKFQAFRPDVIINFAGILGGVNSQNVKEIFETNFMGNINLLEQCVAHGVKKFVFASSLTVHGSNDPKSPNTLDSPFRPIHAYGASKAASEFALQEYAKRFGLSVVALRPTVVLGDIKIPQAPIEFIRSSLRGEPIIVYGTGEHEREWIWVDDAVQGFCRALEFALAAPPGFLPFFLSGNRIAMRDLARMCAEKFEGEVKFVPSGAKAFTLTCDPEESNRFLGWQVSVGLDEIIENLVDIEKAKLTKTAS